MGVFKDKRGQKFGFWTVLQRSEKKNKNGAFWICECECGTTREVHNNLLKSGASKSCGCRRFRVHRQQQIFDSRYIKQKNGCWEWQGARSKDGYGRFSNMRAHRYSYERYIGIIPESLLVCHTCDNRGCVNPKHLFLGTENCNAKDMVKKGRQLKGSKNRNSKIDENTVVKIRKLRLKGYTYQTLCKKFGLTYDHIKTICMNKVWKHVPFGNEVRSKKIARNMSKGEHRWSAKLTEPQVKEIKLLLKSGVGTSEIAQKYNMSSCSIYDIKQNRSWKHVTI